MVAGRARSTASHGPSTPSWVTSAATRTMLDAVAAALIGIRGAKSQAKVSMRHELSAVEFSGPQAVLDAVRLAEGDLMRAGRITAAPTYVVDERRRAGGVGDGRRRRPEPAHAPGRSWQLQPRCCPR